MKRFWWSWAIFFGCGFTLYAQPVEFPLGWYSFADIAQRMSVGGRSVVCSPELKSRMALLSIKTRKWDQMRSLLEHSMNLSIELENAEQKRWRLTRDPIVMQREKAIREKLASLLEDTLQENAQKKLGQRVALFESLPLPMLLQEQSSILSLVPEFRQHLKDLLTPIGDADPGTVTPQILTDALRGWAMPPLSEALQHWSYEIASLPDKDLARLFGDDARWLKELDKENRAKAILISLGLTLDYFRSTPITVWLYRQRKPSLAISAVENGSAWQCSPMDFIGNPVLEWFLSGKESAYRRMLPSFLKGSPPLGVVEYQWTLSSGAISLERRCAVIRNDDYVLINTDSVDIATKTDSLLLLFEKVDHLYHSDYVQATQRHRQLLKEAVGRSQFGSKEEIKHLYSLIRDWARELRQEVVIELHPHRAGCEAVPRNTLEAIALSLRDEGVWRVEQVDGVWVWRNWLAFVDRVPDFPLAALHQLVFSPRTPADWRRFVQQTTPTQAKWLTLAPNFPNAELLFGSPEWLGPLPFVGKQWLIFRLIERVPSWEMRLRQARGLEYPLGQLPAFALRRWVGELVQVGGEAFADEGWEVCAWLGQEAALVEAAQRAGRLHLTLGRTMFGEVLLEDKAIIGCPLPINLPKQK